MHAEFLRDEQNNIWFTYAKKIHFRRLVKNKAKEMLNDMFSDTKIIDN